MFQYLPRALGWAANRIPTLLVWVGLVALFVYGSSHGWKFGNEKKKEDEKAKPLPEDREPFTPYFLPQSGSVPVLVTHDPKHCSIGEKPVVFKSLEAAAKAGLKTIPAECDWVSVTIDAHGKVIADPTALTKVSSRAGGVLVAIQKQLGDSVRQGELLALVESADVGKAKAAYLSAKVNRESREQILSALRSSADPNPRSVMDAEAAAREARANLYSARQAIANLGLPLPSLAEEQLPDELFTRRLLLLGVPFGQRLALLASAAHAGQPPSANLLPIFSPLDGVVTNRTGVVGETVAALQPIIAIGDPKRVYVALDVRQEDMARVAVGQNVTFRMEGGVDLPAVDGTIDWISPIVDEKTRTVQARVKVSNANGTLRSGAFGGGTITVEPPYLALVVPREAVHWEGCAHIVFVKKSAMEYWPRKVTLGVRNGDTVEITSGLEVGDEIVTVGSHVLKNELLKERIGAEEE